MQSQNLYSGYIVKDGDKTEGFISFNSAFSRKIQFKKNQNEEATTLTPGEISGFYLSDEKSEFISVLEESTGEYLFTEVIVKGKATLSMLKNLYTVSVNNQSVQLYLPLSKNPSGADRELHAIQREQIVLIGKLKELLKECLMPDFEKSMMPLKEEKLLSAVRQFNNCVGQVNSTDRKSRVAVGILGGYQLTSVTFKDSRFEYFEGKGSPVFGADMDLIPKYFLKKALLNVQVLVWQNKYVLDENSPLAPLEINLDHSVVCVPTSLKFFFKPGRSGFLLNPGITTSVAFGGDTNTTLMDIESFVLGGFVGIGYENRISARQRIFGICRLGSSLTSPFNRGANQLNLQFLMGYRF
ncbi:MAG: hypothetical protein KF687_02805 [Cyclobacteriaceae bacterium]|nr:hypothetical protein [Cyclobacteriaceae bacterium]